MRSRKGNNELRGFAVEKRRERRAARKRQTTGPLNFSRKEAHRRTQKNEDRRWGSFWRQFVRLFAAKLVYCRQYLFLFSSRFPPSARPFTTTRCRTTPSFR